MPDTITVQGLAVQLAGGAGPSAFGLSSPPPCPAELDVEIVLHDHVVPHCVKEDEMQGLGVNYSSVSKAIYAVLSDRERTWAGPVNILAAAAAVPLKLDAVDRVVVRARFPRALLHAQSAEYTREFAKKSRFKPISCTIRDIRVACIVGLHPHERAERQRLEVDIKASGFVDSMWDHKAVHDAAFQVG